MSASKSKSKMSLPSNDGETYVFKQKDLIWAKMKGFTPWPAMVVDPPFTLLAQARKATTKCVFFFGTRNFAWIELNSMKPFEGPWKESLLKVNRNASFKVALNDINRYVEDPTEVDALIDEEVNSNHVTEADFDKIRDGLDAEGTEGSDAAGGDIGEGGDHVEGDNGIGGADAGVVRNNAAAYKTPVKRAPKAKSSAAAIPKSAKSANSGSSQKSVKRPRTSINASATKRKRISSADVYAFDDNQPSTSKRSKLHSDALAHVGSFARRNMNSALLDRPVVSRPEAQTIDMNARSQTLLERDIQPSAAKFGFLGLGIMGATIVKDLINTGHKVIVWNRTMSKCKPFADAGATVKDTPMDVVEEADIIFCCVSGPKASKDLVFGNCGVLQYKDLCNKAYVEMSTIDPETSQDIAEGIASCNGRYLEVQIHGTRQEAEDGMLIILAGGDRTVFEDCHSCFKTIAKNTFFLGEVGNACKVNLILQTIMGVSMVGLAEALALADRFSISLKDIIDIFELTSMKSQLLLAKGREMAKGDFNPQQPLSHMQKDLRLVLNMAENLDQSMPVTAITNEVFKHTKRLGYSEHDSSAVFATQTNDATAAKCTECPFASRTSSNFVDLHKKAETTKGDIEQTVTETIQYEVREEITVVEYQSIRGVGSTLDTDAFITFL